MTRTYPLLLAILIVAALLRRRSHRPVHSLGKLLRDERGRASPAILGASSVRTQPVSDWRRPRVTARAHGAITSASSGTRRTAITDARTARSGGRGTTSTWNWSPTMSPSSIPAQVMPVFPDERGQRINGQWTGSPSPVEHDILTGSNADGTLASARPAPMVVGFHKRCRYRSGTPTAWGPANTAAPLSSWNSAHANQNCSNTAPRGGAGRFYCFAVD